LAKDFIAFILSAEGQAVVNARGHIAVDENAPAFARDANLMPESKLVVAGSTSVTPVMEKLREAYLALSPGAVIEIQQSDSSGGLLSLAGGNCDIAMSSRELKDGELRDGLAPVQIALDGLAVIVHPENPVDNLTREQVKAVFTGQVTRWDGVTA
jgi:phosphate transport system substrate-binding protein